MPTASSTPAKMVAVVGYRREVVTKLPGPRPDPRRERRRAGTVPSSFYRNTRAGWKLMPNPNHMTVGNSEVGGIFAVDADHVVMSSAGQTLIGRWTGTGFAIEDDAFALPMPVLFQPPGGKMLAGRSGGLVEHD